MPFYEYECTACHHELEALQKFSDAPLTECPACHQQTLVKKVSAAGFRLTGGGWYETDFKSGKKKNLASESGASADAASAAPAATETKTAAPAPAAASKE
jgi:putative FmdB family regulatory protein